MASLVRAVPDFPKPGVLFRDLMPVFADAEAFGELVEAMAAGAEPAAADVVLGIEARGFVLGAAVARALRLGLVCARKPGKLPLVGQRVDYELEYGTETLELPAGVLAAGRRVLIVDDVLATGGTMAAACELVEAAGARVAGIVVAVELTGLDGRARLGGRPLTSVLAM